MGEAKSSSNARDEKGKFNAWVHNRNAAGHHHALDTIAPIERRQYENTIIPFGSIVILFLMTHNVRINVVRPQLGEAYANCKSYSKKSKQTKMYIDASLTTTVDSTHHFPICSSNKISGSSFVRCFVLRVCAVSTNCEMFASIFPFRCVLNLNAHTTHRN